MIIVSDEKSYSHVDSLSTNCTRAFAIQLRVARRHACELLYFRDNVVPILSLFGQSLEDHHIPSCSIIPSL